MIEKRKILYALHIDWNWIKQRPQFLAENLSNKFEIICVYPCSWNFSKKIKNKSENIKLIPVFQIPFNKFGLIKKTNAFIISIFLKIVYYACRCDYIYVPSPWQYKKWMKKTHLIYDCMDNYRAFQLKANVESLMIKEQEIVNSAEYILVSSEYIKNDLMSVYGADECKINVVRNGYSSYVRNENSGRIDDLKELKICYFGTISSWFDFGTISYCLDNIKNIQFHLAGPIDGVQILQSDRIIYDGVISHDKLGEYVGQFDCFVMPFIVNDIIEAVDPVKLYEYINFNKNIICIYYDEIKRFEDFVFFYNDKKEFVDIVRNLLNDNSLKYSDLERKSFLSHNTWEVRAEQISSILLDNLFEN